MWTRIPNTAGIIDHRLRDQSLSYPKTVPKKGVGASILRGRELTLPLQSSVADPDPSDPYVFGPPGSLSGSISQRYGSGSFYHQAKIVRKTLISTVF
jgi:hypothetical protein